MREQNLNERVLGLIWSRLDPNFLITERAGDDLRDLREAAMPGLLRIIRGHAWKRGYAPNWEAVAWLAPIGEQVVEGAFYILMETTDCGARWAAGEVLGYNIGGSAVPALVEALERGDVETRRIAAYAMIHARDVQTLPALINALGDPDPEVGLSAIKALRMIGDRSAIAALDEAIATGQCASVQAAQWAIAQLEHIDG